VYAEMYVTMCESHQEIVSFSAVVCVAKICKFDTLLTADWNGHCFGREPLFQCCAEYIRGWV